jgi:Fungal specific transcription factor domain
MTTPDSTETNSSNMVVISPAVAEGVVSSALNYPPVSKEIDCNGIYFGIFRPNYQQRCMDAFYHYFYDAHPFLPPRHQLLQLLKTNPMEHLQTAMCYIGSRYVSGLSTEAYALEFESYLSDCKPAPKDASMVQAMLLFALGLDGNKEREKAIEVLTKAQALAAGLGMNQREYAVINGRGSSVCEESLRRSWWELYVVSVMAAGFHGRATFHRQDSLSNVPLPCEEKEFASGVS